MTYQQMKKIKVKLPPYFILKDGSKNETKYNLSYHFHGEDQNTINIFFNKTVGKIKRDTISLGIYNNKIKNEFEKSKLILDNKNITEKKLIEIINKIRF